MHYVYFSPLESDDCLCRNVDEEINQASYDRDYTLLPLISREQNQLQPANSMPWSMRMCMAGVASNASDALTHSFLC